eukprot:1044022-Karenia_brevis.AAC.1
MVTSNVTSMWTQFDEVVNLPGQILMLQETRLTEDAQRLMDADLRGKGWCAVWGKPQLHQNREVWKHVPSQFNATHGGVAVL